MCRSVTLITGSKMMNVMFTTWSLTCKDVCVLNCDSHCRWEMEQTSLFNRHWIKYQTVLFFPLVPQQGCWLSGRVSAFCHSHLKAYERDASTAPQSSATLPFALLVCLLGCIKVCFILLLLATAVWLSQSCRQNSLSHEAAAASQPLYCID